MPNSSMTRIGSTIANSTAAAPRWDWKRSSLMNVTSGVESGRRLRRSATTRCDDLPVDPLRVDVGEGVADVPAEGDGERDDDGGDGGDEQAVLDGGGTALVVADAADEGAKG